MKDVLLDVLVFVLVDALVFELVDELGLYLLIRLLWYLCRYTEVLSHVLVKAHVCVPVE